MWSMQSIAVRNIVLSLSDQSINLEGKVRGQMLIQLMSSVCGQCTPHFQKIIVIRLYSYRENDTHTN